MSATQGTAGHGVDPHGAAPPVKPCRPEPGERLPALQSKTGLPRPHLQVEG